MRGKFGISNMMISGRKTVVNGVEIDVPNGSSISVINGDVYIDNKKYTEGVLEDGKVVHITINGDVGNLKADCEVTVQGNVNGRVDSGMSVDVYGDVNGNVSSGMSIDIKGNQTGNVSAGMSVDIGTKIYK